MTFRKLIQSTLCLTASVLTLAGCGHVNAAGSATLKSTGLHYASKAVMASFPYRLGWSNPSATSIKNDLVAPLASATESLGFQVKDVDPNAKKVDLRSVLSPVADQGNFGSCTSFAMVKGIGEFMELAQIRAKGGDTTKDFVPLSPRFLWYDERAYMGNEKIDTGANMFLGMNLLVSDGACAETSYPYCPVQLQQNDNYRAYFLADAPSKDAQAEARSHRGGQLIQITKLSQIKDSLDQGFPSVFGFEVFSSIRQATKGGMLPVPNLQEDECLGGHATVAVGYDDSIQCLILRNSWGDQWGDKGYFYMPYDYFNTQVGLVGDGWTIRPSSN